MKKIVFLISLSLIVFMDSSGNACSEGDNSCPTCQICQKFAISEAEYEDSGFFCWSGVCGYTYKCVPSPDPSCNPTPAPQPTPESAWDTVINETNRVSCEGAFEANTTPCDGLWRALGNYCTISGDTIAAALFNLTGQSIVSSQSCDTNPDGSIDTQSCVTICNITEASQGPSSCPQLCEGYCPTPEDTGRAIPRSGKRLWVAPPKKHTAPLTLSDRGYYHQGAIIYYNGRYNANRLENRRSPWCRNSMNVSPACAKCLEEEKYHH